VHPFFDRADALSRDVIGAAIEVHRFLGPGLLESIYEKSLGWELQLRKICYENQRAVKIDYKGFIFEEPLRFDMLIEGALLLELKAVEQIHPIHKAQVLSYMKLLNIPLGLIFNFHEAKLVDGISRLVLPGANAQPSFSL
jgi:GxxExxY protein